MKNISGLCNNSYLNECVYHIAVFQTCFLLIFDDSSVLIFFIGSNAQLLHTADKYLCETENTM